MPKLGVNIDHIATLRQARKEFAPDPVAAAKISERAGADSIVCHLREDRRHMQDRDIVKLRRVLKKPLNLEMSLDKGIVDFAVKIKPAYAMLVPERRQEVTTEGGLDVVNNFRRIKLAAARLKRRGIVVSIFIDPAIKQINKAREAGAGIIELHTGCYANAKNNKQRTNELTKLRQAARYARSIGLTVHAGHGLNYKNVRAVARIKEIDELNIGHAIISRAVFAGLGRAVKEMKRLVN